VEYDEAARARTGSRAAPGDSNAAQSEP
jgi:hypothetical protein